MTPPGPDGGGGELTQGGNENLLDGGDVDLLVDGLRLGDGSCVLLVHAGDGDLLVSGLIAGGEEDGDGDLMVRGLLGGCGEDGDSDFLVRGLVGGDGGGGRLPVVATDGARAVFSMASRSARVEKMRWGRTARLGRRLVWRRDPY